MLAHLTCVAAAVFSSTSASAQNPSGKLDGAWINTRDSVVAPDTTYQRIASPGLLVMSGRYFSQTGVLNRFPGAQQASTPSTMETKAARYDALIANAGTQEVGDSVITIHVRLAKNPSAVGSTAKATYRLRGDTLWFTISRRWERDTTKVERTTQIYVRQR